MPGRSPGRRQLNAESDAASGLTLQFPGSPAMICRTEARRAAAQEISALKHVLLDKNRHRVEGLTCLHR